EKPKTPRRRQPSELANKPFTVLPPISRLREPVEPPKPTPPPPEEEPVVETPEEPVAAAPEAVEPEEGKDEKDVHLKPPIIVRDLAAAMGLKPFQVIGDLMQMNIFVSLNQPVDPEVATRICEKHGFTFEKEKREKGAGVHKVVEKIIEPPKEAEPPKEEELK